MGRRLFMISRRPAARNRNRKVLLVDLSPLGLNTTPRPSVVRITNDPPKNLSYQLKKKKKKTKGVNRPPNV